MNNGFKDISTNLYPKFIENDDKSLLKLIKRLLIIYKRCRCKLLCKMIHKWQIISYKINFSVNNELKNELEEPKLEKKPKVYSTFLKEKEKNKKMKLNQKKNSIDNNSLPEENILNDLIIKQEINEENNGKKEEIKENDFNDLIEFDKINENNDIINIYDKNESIKNDTNNNYKTEISKSKSVEKLKNINFRIEKPKKWEYSYYRNKNNEEKELKNKNKKKLMSNNERQQLFNDLYNDCKKRKEKFRKLKMEKEAQFNTLYTFTPKIFQNKLNEKYMKNMADSKFFTKTNSNINISENNLINNIVTNTNIGGIPNDKIEENKIDSPLNFISRLSEYEKIRKQNLEKLRNEIYINYDKNKISNRNRKSYDKLLNNHLLNDSENFLEIKRKNIEKIKNDMDKEQGITFQPKTNKVFNNKIKNDIIERNNEFMREKKEKLEKFSNIREKECTFKPKINNVGITINKDADKKSNISCKTEQNNSDVSKRLFDYQKKYKDNLEDMRSKYKEHYSFNPIISKNTEQILNNRQKLKEKIEEKIDIESQNYELLKKQIKLGELEELSKKLEEIKNDNLEINENVPPKKKKINNEGDVIQNKINKNTLNNKEIINNNNENSNKIIELANNLVNNNKILLQNDKIPNKNENTNDFILLMNNNTRSKNISIQRNYNIDLDSSKGSKKIMNLNYYDNLF